MADAAVDGDRVEVFAYARELADQVKPIHLFEFVAERQGGGHQASASATEGQQEGVVFAGDRNAWVEIMFRQEGAQ